MIASTARDQSPHVLALSCGHDLLDSYGDIRVTRNPEICTAGSAFLLIVSLFRLRFEGTSCISISFGHFCNLFPLIIRIHTSLTWSSRPPSSPRILVSFGVRSVVPSSFFVLAFLQVESVGGLIVERKVPLFHPCDCSPLASFVNNLTYYLSSLPLATMLAQRKSRSRRQSRRFSPNRKSCRPLQGM